MSGPIPAQVAAAAAQHAAQAVPLAFGMGERNRRRFEHTRAELMARVHAYEANEGTTAKQWARMDENVRLLLALPMASASGLTAQAIALSRWSELPATVRDGLCIVWRQVSRATANPPALNS